MKYVKVPEALPFQFDNFVECLKKHNPKLKIKYKDESFFMRLLGTLMFFNKSFMTSFITTIGNTVYFPSRESVENNLNSRIITLAHEYRHICDNKKLGFIYNIIYLAPQVLALLGILFAFIFWPIAVGCVLFLLPLPAYGRMRIEFRGYLMSLYATNLMLLEFGLPEDMRRLRLGQAVEQYNKNFTGSAYYFMWPFGVKKQLTKNLDLILSDEILKTDKAFNQVKLALQETFKND